MEFQADIIRAIQSISTPFLDLVMQAITILGEQIFLVPVAALIFWCVSKELGYWLCGCAAAGNLTVNALKTVFAVARPIGVEGIRVLRASTATGTSFPSGHTQAGANFCTALARATGRRRFYILAAVVPVLIALSRLYCGVHWPTDVLAGLAIGILLPLLLWRLYRRILPSKRPLFFLGLTLIFIPFLFLKGDVTDLWKSFGFSLGIAVGNYLEQKYVRFETGGRFGKLALRYLIGMGIVLVFEAGLKAVFPEGNLFALIRYSILPVVMLAGWPALFKKLGL
ncbi:MAG TPA: phosphatase PAP2 family protein [Oscillospiraceae bacterium]|mgnify:CR=1 FL=1|nr:phosphatase PAP2 family protein [Oscillospiraceae bacterium]HRW56692.1 phosphatase PAP2 family protein [Oscillospiraceae bacterium]